MEGEVRYCTTEGGVRIAYCVEGRAAAFARYRSALRLERVVRGQGVPLRGPGAFVAKGFEEPVRVYEVGWREEE